MKIDEGAGEVIKNTQKGGVRSWPDRIGEWGKVRLNR